MRSVFAIFAAVVLAVLCHTTTVRAGKVHDAVSHAMKEADFAAEVTAEDVLSPLALYFGAVSEDVLKLADKFAEDLTPLLPGVMAIYKEHAAAVKLAKTSDEEDAGEYLDETTLPKTEALLAKHPAQKKNLQRGVRMAVLPRSIIMSGVAASVGAMVSGEIAPIGIVTKAEQAVARGKDWVDENMLYDQKKLCLESNQFGPTAEDTRHYRCDCSGFISMAYRLPESANTNSLKQYFSKIEKDQLEAGDIVLKGGMHVTMFLKWTDDTKKYYISQEEAGTKKGTVSRQVTYAFYGTPGFDAYRFKFLAKDPVPDELIPIGFEGIKGKHMKKHKHLQPDDNDPLPSGAKSTHG